MGFTQHSLERTGFIDVIGGSIHYRYYEPHDKEASKRTPLIVSNGGPGDCLHAYYCTLSDFANYCPVVFYDQLGAYYSPAKITDEVTAFERFVDEISCIVKHLKFEKVNLYGHSWGATIVFDYAAQNQEEVSKLILSSPLISEEIMIADCKKRLSELPTDVQETIKHCEENGLTESEEYKQADEVFLSAFLRRTHRREYAKKHIVKFSKEIYNVMWGPSEFTCTGTLKGIDLTPKFPDIKSPTLLMCGEYDTARPETMKDFQSQMRDCDLVIVPDSGHMTFVDDNEMHVKAVIDFLEK